MKSSVEDLLYDKSLTGQGVEDLMESILDLAQDDLECDPSGIKGEPCDYVDQYESREYYLEEIAMRLHEEYRALNGIKEDRWVSLEEPIRTIVNQTVIQLFDNDDMDRLLINERGEVSIPGDDSFNLEIYDIVREISEAVESDPDLNDGLNNVDADTLDDVINNVASGLIGGLTVGDNWGMAEEVGGKFESCIDSLIENENMEVGDAAAECLEFTSSAFSAEFNLDNKKD